MKTQKARGIAAIGGWLDGFRYKVLPTIESAKEFWPTEIGVDSTDAKVFARPCPKDPQHGFVDSRVVAFRDVYELQSKLEAIFLEAQAADPEAELLIMPVATGAWSAYITPTTLAFGPGNDGATSGHDSIGVGVHGLVIPDSILEAAGFRAKTGEAPFIEIVEHCGSLKAVQLRAGPVLPRAKDYNPAVRTVTRVVEASGDLREWQLICKTQMADPGAVAVHLGGTLGSHYGVHCILNGIPILTTRRPVVGEVLDLIPEVIHHPIPSETFRWAHYGLFSQGISDSETFELTEETAALGGLMVFGAHNAFAQSDPQMASRVLGLAVGATLRLGTMAMLGELRHYRRRRNSISRSVPYRKAWFDVMAGRAQLSKSLNAFGDYKRWNGGYGGQKWEECSLATAKLWNAFTAMGRGGEVKPVIEAVHELVNKAHNGGWLFNKFLGKDVFDAGAEGRASFYLSTLPVLRKALLSEQPELDPRLLKARKLRIDNRFEPYSEHMSSKESSDYEPLDGCTCAACVEPDEPDEPDEPEEINFQLDVEFIQVSLESDNLRLKVQVKFKNHDKYLSRVVFVSDIPWWADAAFVEAKSLANGSDRIYHRWVHVSFFNPVRVEGSIQPAVGGKTYIWGHANPSLSLARELGFDVSCLGGGPIPYPTLYAIYKS